jgi:hypothetical protein
MTGRVLFDSKYTQIPPLAEIRRLLAEDPASVKVKDHSGMLTLHWVCVRDEFCGGSPDVVQCLVEAWPDSVKVRDNEGRLALHLAIYFAPRCFCEVSGAKIRCLIQAWPDSVKEKNQWGLLPLNLACSMHAHLVVIQCIVQVWPDSVKEKDQWGLLPLHEAVPSLDRIRFLVQAGQGEGHQRTSRIASGLYQMWVVGRGRVFMSSLARFAQGEGQR